MTIPDTDRLIVEFAGTLTAEQVGERVADAMCHKAHLKWTDMTRYCRNWLRRSLEMTPRATNATHPRTADYSTWASKAVKHG